MSKSWTCWTIYLLNCQSVGNVKISLNKISLLNCWRASIVVKSVCWTVELFKNGIVKLLKCRRIWKVDKIDLSNCRSVEMSEMLKNWFLELSIVKIRDRWKGWYVESRNCQSFCRPTSKEIFTSKFVWFLTNFDVFLVSRSSRMFNMKDVPICYSLNSVIMVDILKLCTAATMTGNGI